MNSLRISLERLFGFLSVIAVILGIVVGASWYIYQETERQLGALAITIAYITILVSYKMYVAEGQEQ